MLSFEDALERLLEAARPVSEIRELPLTACRGRVLAKSQVAALTVPPLDNSAMDGFAVRCADVSAPGVTLPISQRIPAGSLGAPLSPGTAARIFTGAPIPAGADAVVMQELCEIGAEGHVRINTIPKPGDNIRRAGEDILAGSEILAAGTRLQPAHLGLAASVGLARLPVFRRLRVALLTTGNELVEPGEPVAAGKIYDANRYFLTALLEGYGCEVIDYGRIEDTFDATRAALLKATAASDLILTTGGVSVGEEDHVKAALESLGQLALWQIALKPGKPLAFGTLPRTTPAEGEAQRVDFIGLPGNPVSSYVTFLLLVRPFLLKRMGATALIPPRRRVISASAWRKPAPNRREFLRARLTADGRAELYPNQSSGVLTSCVWADGVIDNPPGRAFDVGDTVEFIAFSDLL
ncbi:MAG: molybdopterin molybdotransferase MoeA [Rhodocyclaceae bacterium]|nr:molybdopterin molybdotransferase MoeA [Rhodocyclaceae bacterium]